MAVLVRVLLWTLVLVAPGGVLLAPFVLAKELQLRRTAAPANSN